MAPHRMLLSIALLSVALVITVPCVPPAWSSSVIPVSLTLLTEKADTIVSGVVRETNAYWQGDRIFTSTTLETTDFFKHTTPAPQEKLVIQSLGGHVGDVGMEVHGVPRLQPGEEVLLFLVKTNDTYAIYGLYYGLCRISTDPENKSLRINGPLFQARTTWDPTSMATQLNPLPDQGEELDLFIQRIRQLTAPPAPTPIKEGLQP